MKTIIKSTAFKIILSLLLALGWTTPALAHSSPGGCTGSGLGISLFSSLTQVHIGDTIQYSVVVFNGTGSGPVVCDATGITASLVTPDGVNHPITLTRTTLTNGQNDTYLNVVSYVANASDMNPVTGILAATASDQGTIHQNVVDSSGGANQGLNVFVLSDLHVIKVVINDDGGTAVPASFNVHVKTSGTDVAGSPAAGTGSPGTLYELIAATYTISEDSNPSYAVSFSGVCNASGVMVLSAGNDVTCTITNNDIAAPLVPTATPTPTITPTPTSPTTSPTAPPSSPNPTSSSSGPTACASSGITALPVIVSATRLSPTSVFLSWGTIANFNNFIVQYGFQNGNWQFSTQVSGFSTTVNNLPANQSIWGRVAVTDNCATGTFTNPVLFGGTKSPGFPNTGSPRLPDTGINPEL